MRVPLQHGPAHVAHQGEHGGLGDARLRHFCSRCVPQIMQPALHLTTFAQRVPGARDITHRPGGIQRPPVGSFALPSGKNIPFRFWLADLPDIPASMILDHFAKVAVEGNLPSLASVRF